MSDTELISKLAEQSKKQVEPFNLPAYRELITRKNVDSSLLVAQVNQAKNGDALLPLLLLRTRNTMAYNNISKNARAAILTDALDSSKTFNT